MTAKQKERARACKTPEEMLALAQEECLGLTDDETQLDDNLQHILKSLHVEVSKPSKHGTGVSRK